MEDDEGGGGEVRQGGGPGAGKEHSVYSTASAVWDEKEIRILEEGRKALSPDHYSNMAIYVKLAAKLPQKTVRDVAARFRLINSQQQSALHQQQHAALIASGHYMAGLAQVNGAVAAVTAARPDAALITGPKLSNKEVETKLQSALLENSRLIAKIRENLVTGSLSENVPLMEKFHENCEGVRQELSSLNLRMPPLPVHVNTCLFDPAVRKHLPGAGALLDVRHQRNSSGEMPPDHR